MSSNFSNRLGAQTKLSYESPRGSPEEMAKNLARDAVHLSQILEARRGELVKNLEGLFTDISNIERALNLMVVDKSLITPSSVEHIRDQLRLAMRKWGWKGQF